MYKVITGRLLEAQGYYSEVKRKVTENIGTKRKSIIRCIREGKRILKKSWIIGYYILFLGIEMRDYKIDGTNAVNQLLTSP